MAYFDYNATTPINSAAREVFIKAMDQSWSNPSSPYRQSAKVHNVLESAREELASRLNKSSSEVIFTGGATEANNSVIRFLEKHLPEGKMVAISPFEHPSVAEAVKHGFPKFYNLKSNAGGTVDLNDLVDLFGRADIGAVSVMAVNNETGVIQPWEEIAELCRNAGVIFHCDASQWFGKCAGGTFDNCDFIVGCAHKFGGPKGVGILALSENGEGICSQYGGGQESGRRGGTENIPSILALVAALADSEKRLKEMEAQAAYRDGFEATLLSEIHGMECIGKSATRVSNTSFVLLPKYENIRWVRKLDVLGFQVSTGSACSSGKTSVSPVLEALGYPADAGRRTVRISSSFSTSASDWGNLADAFVQVWCDLQETENASGSEVISI